jgi:hypothetical protein
VPRRTQRVVLRRTKYSTLTVGRLARRLNDSLMNGEFRRKFVVSRLRQNGLFACNLVHVPDCRTKKARTLKEKVLEEKILWLQTHIEHRTRPVCPHELDELIEK